MSALIDAHQAEFGVEPICRVLGVAPSTYYAVKARERVPAARTLSDRQLLGEIRRVHAASHGLYGTRKVWWQLRREGIPAARCTVERLMRRDGLAGVVRGRRRRTTIPDNQAPRPLDLVDREPDGSGLGRGACSSMMAGNFPVVFMSSVGEATRKDCGVLVAMPQGLSWAPPLSSGSMVNVGTVRYRPPRWQDAGGRAGTSSADGAGRGGARVVVRGRESRPHGKGGQRVRSRSAARPGGRR